MFLGKGVLKICSKFTEEHPWRSGILGKLQSNFTEMALRLGCSPVNLWHVFRAPFFKNTSGRLLLCLLLCQSYLKNNKSFISWNSNASVIVPNHQHWLLFTAWPLSKTCVFVNLYKFLILFWHYEMQLLWFLRMYQSMYTMKWYMV